MKITMISVHSSGQPSRKMITCASSMNCTGVRSIDSTQALMISCPPSSANAAEKMLEPTNSQHTIALVLVGQVGRLRSMPRLKRRYAIASSMPPNAPIAAASVGVASPNTMLPRTARIMNASGNKEPSSILKISSRAKLK